MQRTKSLRRQGGAVIVTASLVLLFLLGFMGFALDFAHLFVVKSELQTAMDSCALAAAQELDAQPDTITRAQSAGRAAGNLNAVDFQSLSWSGQGMLVDAEITFMDANYVATATPANARYVQCQHTQPSVQMWLMNAMGAFSAEGSTYPNTQNVMAFAVATRASAQSTCPVPVGLKPKAGGTAPDYGFAPGEWVRMLMSQNAAAGGQIGWMNLDGSSSAAQTEAEMNGSCGTEVGDELGTPGVQASIADAWNSRFGIYKNNSHPWDLNRTPDFSGYSYTATNWPSRQNAYADFVEQRLNYSACAPSGSVKGANGCEGITGLSLNGFQSLASAGQAGEHAQYGASRRIVTVPIVDAGSHVVDYACMLMLQPLTIPMSDVYLEFIGNASAINSPCTTSGLPGGWTGPKVPVLVR